MVRTIYLTLVLAAAAVAAAVFAWLNPGDITLDIAFTEVTVPIAFAFAAAVALGWAIGWVSVAAVLARMKADQFFLKRRLRRVREQSMPPPPDNSPRPAGSKHLPTRR